MGWGLADRQLHDELSFVGVCTECANFKEVSVVVDLFWGVGCITGECVLV